MPKFNLETLRQLAVQVLENSRVSRKNSISVANALIAAEADGISSHGLSRLLGYCDQALSGKVDGFATPVEEFPVTGVIRVDAKSGFAYPAIDAALRACENISKESSIIGIAISNSHHAGVLGYHVERFAKLGFIAMGFTNSPAAIAPWGGNRALFGTNPIAFACPRKGAPPIVIDLSLSKVPRSRITLAAEKGEQIPLGWAVNSDGQGVQDPRAALLGTLLPIGEAKGAALALMVEIMTAGITGSNFGFQASSFFSAEGDPPHIGQFFLVFDPKPFSGDTFFIRTEILCEAISSQSGARLPGERRFETRKKNKLESIDIPKHLVESLKKRLP